VVALQDVHLKTSKIHAWAALLCIKLHKIIPLCAVICSVEEHSCEGGRNFATYETRGVGRINSLPNVQVL
jgi:hypothetical protein